MKKLSLTSFAILALSLQLFAQITPPSFSKQSGFYDVSFDLEISHVDPSALIIYTTDGSEPSLDHIEGYTYPYKNLYQEFSWQTPAEMLYNELKTFIYSSTITIDDATLNPNKLAGIATAYQSLMPLTAVNQYKGTVIRAKAIVGGVASPTITANYFITEDLHNRYTLPVFCFSINEDELYDYNSGLFVPGKTFDDWRADNPSEDANIWTAANYWQSGSESERELHLNVFYEGVPVIDQNVGIRNHGNGSRYFRNRSFRMYAKSAYGKSTLKHHFFDNYSLNSFKRLILRNSGSDNEQTMFRDALIQSLVAHLNIETQSYQPIVSFINGEYYGIFNLRERFDEKHFEEKYNIKEDDLELLENGEVEVGTADNFNALQEFAKNNDLKVEDAYNYVAERIDINNLIDYYITGIFIVNTDWPFNNNMVYRKNVPLDPTAAFGHDGKWRWILKDTDFGFNAAATGLPDNINYNMLKHVLESKYLPGEFEHSVLFNKLFENSTFKFAFINRWCDLMNTSFNETHTIAEIEKFKNRLDPEINEHINRWGYITSKEAWEDDINKMIDFAQLRPEIATFHLLNNNNSDSLIHVDIRVNDTSFGFVKINSIDLKNSTVGIEGDVIYWRGKYFNDVPITLTAIPHEGYQFSHWSGSIKSDGQEQILVPNTSMDVTAHFVPIGGVNLSERQVSDLWTLTPNPVNDFLQLKNDENVKSSYSIFDINGRLVKSETFIQSTTIDVSQFSKGVYFMIINSTQGTISKQFIKEKKKRT